MSYRNMEWNHNNIKVNYEKKTNKRKKKFNYSAGDEERSIESVCEVSKSEWIELNA